MEISPSGDYLAVTNDSSVSIISIERNDIIQKWQTDGSVYAVAWSSYGAQLSFAGEVPLQTVPTTISTPTPPPASTVLDGFNRADGALGGS